MTGKLNLCATLWVVFATLSWAELLDNSGFESSLSAQNWFCNSCEGRLVRDSKDGQRSMLATRRGANWQGPEQQLNLVLPTGSSYTILGYVKLIGASGKGSENFYVTMRHTLADGATQYQRIAEKNTVSSSNGWVKIEGRFSIPNYGQRVKSQDVYIEGPAAYRDFLADAFSLKPEGSGATNGGITKGVKTKLTGWRGEADTRIEKIRKSNLIINVKSSLNKGSLKVQVRQKSHEFAFGSAVDSQTLQNNMPYRQWYMDNFEWAVLENDHKWPQTEWNRNQFTWQNADTAMKILRDNSKIVRGHTIHWADTRYIPSWVKNINDKTEFFNVCMKRVDDLLTRYRGQLAHWDVNNEMLPHSFYKTKYGGDWIRYNMFHRAKAVDPNAKLFLNEYSVVSDGTRTASYVRMIQEFKKNGVPVGGIGAQSHFGHHPNGPNVLQRLDQLATQKLPIFITELDYPNKKPQTRADGLEDAVRAYFSHEAVEGVLLWGFWEGRHWRGSDAALVNGANMTPNAAGLMWQRLMREWSSNIDYQTSSISAGQTNSNTMRVFHGTFEVTVLDGSNVLKKVQVSVPSTAATKSITISL